jgi:hypothetical protein
MRAFAIAALASVAVAWSARGSDLASAPRVVAREALGDVAVDRVLDDADAKSVPRKVHLKQSLVTVAIAQAANGFLDKPMGSEAVRDVEGKPYAFCVEPHYHAPDSGKTPVGWHKGVTVYAFED